MTVLEDSVSVARTEAVVDLSAIRGNVETLRAAAPTAELLAVVKADGYGHGLIPSARAALAGGAAWLGTAIVDECLALRAAGITVPLLAWLWSPSEAASVRAAIRADVDLAVNSVDALRVLTECAQAVGRQARAHYKIDTGLSRNGATLADWPELMDAAAEAHAAGDVLAVGVWSHFAYADAPGHPTIGKQLDVFDRALDMSRRHGVAPQVRHIANSAATLTLPDAHYDLVRPGIAVYGLSPVSDGFGLRPAMTLQAEIALTKRIAAGSGVSYGHEYVTEKDTTVALIPLGYADGVPRAASNAGPVSIHGRRFAVSGRVCMDQIVVDTGELPVHAGDTAVLFGPDGPTAQEWADIVGTIHYEIVTRIGPRVMRRYVQ